MAQTASLVLILSLSIVVATATTSNICFDDKEILENMSEFQKECSEMLRTNGENGPKMILCVFNKMGFLKESGDSFDFAKTRENILSEIEDKKMITTLSEELSECETDDPTGGMEYYSCFIRSYRQNCYRMDGNENTT